MGNQEDCVRDYTKEEAADDCDCDESSQSLDIPCWVRDKGRASAAATLSVLVKKCCHICGDYRCNDFYKILDHNEYTTVCPNFWLSPCLAGK